VLSVRKDDAADSNHVHAADGFPDDREGVVPDFPVRNEIIGPDEIAWIDVALGNELVDVDGTGGFEGDVFQLVLRYLDVGIGIDLVPFMMSSFETSSPVSASTFMYLMRWPVFRLIWLKLIFSESEVAGYKATGQVTSERRKKPFQLARGAIQILLTLQNPDSRRSCLVGSDN